MTQHPNPSIHVYQSRWMYGQTSSFPYAAITAAIRRQQQVVVAPLLPPADDVPQVLLPSLLLPTILEIGDRAPDGEGVLVRAVGFVSLEFVDAILKDPSIMFKLAPRTLEELVAGDGNERAPMR